MSQIYFNNDKYNEKTYAFNSLREGATALRKAKAISKTITSWNPATRKGTSEFKEKTIALGRDIGGVANYFDNKRSSALEIICNDSFTLHYQIYGSIGGQAVFGQNTLSLFLPIKWDRCWVSAKLYADSLSKTVPREKMVTAAREGIPNRDEIAKVTGWSRDAVRNIADQDLSMFKVLVDQVTVGQSKLTRLVKGFLMLLESMEREHIDVVLDVQNYITYNPQNVINSFAQGDRAYVFNSKPTSAIHTAVLWRMCGAYPPPEIQSHVSIPSDGPNVFMVLEGVLGNIGRPVRLMPGMIYASIMAYAMDVSCTEHLQQALIIACSLQQNRYFSNVKLPKVVSVYDLMVPAFMHTNSQLDKPILSMQMAKSIGRLHQMLLFMNVKDILTAAELSTQSGFDPSDSMRSYLSSQVTLLNQMAGEISALNLIEATLKLRIHECMRENDFSDILSISAFEGLWLCQNSVKSVENGILSALINGVHDLSGDTTSYDIVKREMDLGGIRYDTSLMPHGSFTVGWVNVTKTEDERIKVEQKRISKHIRLTHDCNKKPGTNLRSGRKERFGPEEKPSRPVTPTTAVPLFRPRRAKTNSDSGSSIMEIMSEPESNPPSYKSPEPSTSSGEDSIAMRTKIAHEIAGRVSPELTQKRPANISTVQSIANDTSVQIPTAEYVATIVKRSGMNWTGKEVGSFSKIMEDVGFAEGLQHQKDFKTLVSNLERRQAFINYEGNGMLGNSKEAKLINDMIDRGSKKDTTGSMLRSMMDKKREWVGVIAKAPKEGIRHVSNSPAWLRFIEDKLVNPGEKDPASGQQMNQVMANLISRMPESINVEDVGVVYRWVSGTDSAKFPISITKEELDGAGEPRTLEFLKAPASFGPRKANEEDSKLIVLAASVPRSIIDQDYLKTITGKFRLEKWMMENMRKYYGLFEGKK